MFETFGCVCIAPVQIDHELKQGMLMLVDLKAASRDALVISESALVPLGSNNFVFVVKEESGNMIVDRRQIVIGERLAGSVEVLSGLSAGDKLVTHGLQKIRQGQKVSILGEESLADKESHAATESGENKSLSDFIKQKNN